MFIASGLLATVLVGGGPPPAPIAAEMYRCDVRMLEMKGIGWRGEMYSKLTPVARKGTVTVWSAGPGVAQELTQKAVSLTEAPRITHPAGGRITVDAVNVRALVCDMKRCADGPFNQSKLIAYTPEVDQYREGFEVEMTGEPTEKGVLLRIALNDSRIAAVRTYSITEKTVGDEQKGAKPASLSAQVQVPEVVRSGVEGEWLVPSQGALVVSMGTFTLADDKGKAEVRERVAVIEAEAVAAREFADAIQATATPRPRARPVAKDAARPANPLANLHPPTVKIVQEPGELLADLQIPSDVHHASAIARFALKAPDTSRPAPPTSPQLMVGPPVPIGPFLLPVLASPTVMPAPIAAPVAAKPEKAAPTHQLTVSAFALPGFPLPILACRVAVEPLAAKAPMPMPATPARALPTAVAADGSVVALPPLPEEFAPEAIDASAEPRPAPQARPQRLPALVKPIPGMLVKAAPAPKATVDDIVLFPAPSEAVARRAEVRAAEDEPVRELTLHHAIALALENGETTCVVGDAGARRKIEVRPVDPEARSAEFREECAALVRSVTQQYGALQLASAEASAREKAVQLGEQVLRREESRHAHGRNDAVVVAEVREHLDRLRLEAVEASATLVDAERQLRALAGLPQGDARRIVAVSKAREDKVHFDLADCLAEKLASRPEDEVCGPPSALQDIHALRTMLRDVDASHRGFQSARRLMESARERLRSATEAYERGAMPVDRYLDSLGRWADAVAKEAGYRAEYGTAIACVEEWKGSLLASHDVSVAIPSKSETAAKGSVISPSDAVEQAAYVGSYFQRMGPRVSDDGESKTSRGACKPQDEVATPAGELSGTGSDRIGITVLDSRGMDVYCGGLSVDALRDDPLTLRLPTSNGGVVEITARLVKKPASSK